MNKTIIPQDHTVLVVDDDMYITEMIELYLTNKGFQVLSAYNGQDALNLLQENEIHCMILDIMLPKISGWEVCKAVRDSSDIPIIMLTAREQSEDKVQGLTIGADDYLVKPFDPNELIARVIALLRRRHSNSSPQRISAASHVYGSLKVDTLSHIVTNRNELIDLTPREFQLLLVFTKHPNQVFERQQLLDLVWGEDYMGEDRVVDVFVTRLRSKLANDGENWKIDTVRGIGYKFRVNDKQ
ncbi:response regulator transcription factor [Neobacillus sp. PS3-34]|uniref:response regulator transcription factor n=1 Tax=Neobacillus sp. PS3-34 TaxID=3070678 RepID=UPI0027DFD26F|nr:response regulator transcription factor [Neobacillus sp. PS3-34]WML46617.1 response regulator transcription factor [Neobacillus sp. PS3-34]